MTTQKLFKFVALALVVGAIALLVGCGTKAETPKVHTLYTAYGRYYTDGTVITNDGNLWGYSTDSISDKTPTDGMPVWVGMDDNGTPDDITDDIILGLVYDTNTAIDGNNIKINGGKN